MRCFAPPPQKKIDSLHESCRRGRRIYADLLICSLGHCECDGHAVHQLSQWRLTVDWLDPRESDSSLIRSKVFSDWLPSYIKVTPPVLKIFKMAGYFPDSLRIRYCSTVNCSNLFTIVSDVTDSDSGFGGLEVACWPLVQNPAEAVGFLRANKHPPHAFLRRGNKAVGSML